MVIGAALFSDYGIALRNVYILCNERQPIQRYRHQAVLSLMKGDAGRMALLGKSKKDEKQEGVFA
jgi:hypothetical protein